MNDLPPCTCASDQGKYHIPPYDQATDQGRIYNSTSLPLFSYPLHNQARGGQESMYTPGRNPWGINYGGAVVLARRVVSPPRVWKIQSTSGLGTYRSLYNLTCRRIVSIREPHSKAGT